MNSLKFRKFSLIIFVVITVFIIYYSINSMRANAWYFNARNIAQQPVIEKAELVSAINAMSLATKLEPKHPHYWHFYGYLKLKYLNDTFDAQIKGDNQKYYKEIENHLLRSIEYRTEWAESWILLAQIASYQEGASERVYNYIQRAKQAGPYKFDVHLGVLQITLMNWYQLPPKYKALHVNELKLAAKFGYKFNQIFTLAKAIDRLPTLCLSLQFGTSFIEIKKSFIYKRECQL